MKILLADDDKLIRYYMKSLLQGILDFPYEILEVANGNDLVALCQSTQIDIAFVDIKMPYLDGISAIEKAIIHSPSTKFVILTAYADFDYAKRCIPLGILDYVLKPVEEETLKKIFNQYQEELSKDVSLNSLKFEHKVISVFNTPYDLSIIEDTEPTLSTKETYLYYEFFLYCHDYDKDYEYVCTQLYDGLRNHASRFSSKENKVAVFYSSSGNLCYVMPIACDQISFVNHTLTTLMQDLGATAISCIFTQAPTLSKLVHTTHTLKQSSAILFNSPMQTVLDLDACLHTLALKELAFLNTISKITTHFLEKNELEFVFQIKTLLGETDFSKLKLNFTNLISNFEKITLHFFKNTEPKAFFNELCLLSTQLRIPSTSKALDKIDLIKQYIDEYYMREISIANMAERFDLTPNYISKLFHEKIGVRFIDYLTQVRIHHAKSLLTANKDLPIKTIAAMVGYYSPRHFTNLFYKNTHSSPSEYRKSF